MAERIRYAAAALFAFAALCSPAGADDTAAVKETILSGPNGTAIKVRMEGPYTADVPLQVVCYFHYTPAGATKMTGAPVELDVRLGGVIAALRERGEFAGDELETVLIVPKAGSIKAKALLLIGLGAEANLSLPLLERVGKTAAREAARLGVAKVAFAPLIRDQGNTAFKVGAVETAVVRGALLAADTEVRLRKEGFGNPYALTEWWVEAGPAYFDETVAGAAKAAAEAAEIIKAKAAAPFASK